MFTTNQNNYIRNTNTCVHTHACLYRHIHSTNLQGYTYNEKDNGNVGFIKQIVN